MIYSDTLDSIFTKCCMSFHTQHVYNSGNTAPLSVPLIHPYQGINEGDFYTFEGLFQLEQEGSRRCNTMNVLTLYLYKCLSNGRPLNSEDGR